MTKCDNCGKEAAYLEENFNGMMVCLDCNDKINKETMFTMSNKSHENMYGVLEAVLGKEELAEKCFSMFLKPEDSGIFTKEEIHMMCMVFLTQRMAQFMMEETYGDEDHTDEYEMNMLKAMVFFMFLPKRVGKRNK